MLRGEETPPTNLPPTSSPKTGPSPVDPPPFTEGQDNSPPRWQFSTRSLLLAMTATAVTLAVLFQLPPVVMYLVLTLLEITFAVTLVVGVIRCDGDRRLFFAGALTLLVAPTHIGHVGAEVLQDLGVSSYLYQNNRVTAFYFLIAFLFHTICCLASGCLAIKLAHWWPQLTSPDKGKKLD